MKKRTHSVAPLAPSTWSDPNNPNTPSVPGVKILIPPELNARPDRPYVVSADNKPAPVAMLIVVLVADVVLGGSAFLALRYLGNLDGMLSFLLSITGVTGIALFALFLLSGDMPAFFQIQRAERNEGRRIRAVENVALAQVEVAKIHAAAQRTDARARLLEARNSDRQLALALAQQPPAQRLANQLETYVAPEAPSDTLREDMKMWIGQAIDNPALVDADGKFLAPVPWSAKGKLGDRDSKRVREWLATVNNAAPRGWVVDMRDYAWRVNLEEYPTAGEVVAQLAAWPMKAA